MQNSKSIMVDICREYLKVAQGKKFEFYRLFSNVPVGLYSKYKGKKSKNEIEVCYAARQLKVKDAFASIYFGDYRIGFYRPDSTHADDSDGSDEVIYDLKQSQVFRDILWDLYKLKIEELERLIESENEEMQKKFNEQAHRQRQRRETEQKIQEVLCRHKKESKFNVEARIRELKVLMHNSHPDKGGDLSLFIYCSKELAKIRS